MTKTKTNKATNNATKKEQASTSSSSSSAQAGKYRELIEDPPIRNQEYALLSFAEPRPNILEQREIFMVKQFFGWFYERFMVNNMMEFMRDVCKESAVDLHAFEEALRNKLSAPVQALDRPEEMSSYVFSRATMMQRYEDYRALHFDDLVNEFRKTLPNDDTAVHGVKVRGVFATIEQAKKHAEMLRQQQVEPFIDIFAAEVGKWVPRNPYPNTSTMNVDYHDEQTQLQELIGSREKEQEQRAQIFQLRREYEAKIREEQKRLKDEEQKLAVDQEEKGDEEEIQQHPVMSDPQGPVMPDLQGIGAGCSADEVAVTVSDLAAEISKNVRDW